MARTEPLNEGGSPPHREAWTMKLEMEDKMVQIKKEGVDGWMIVIKPGFREELQKVWTLTFLNICFAQISHRENKWQEKWSASNVWYLDDKSRKCLPSSLKKQEKDFRFQDR